MWTKLVFKDKDLQVHEVKDYPYHKNPKISDTQKFAVIILKVEQDGFS